MSRLTGGKELSQLNRANPSLGSLLSKLIDAHNHMASQSGVDPVGQASAPPPPQSVTPTVIGEQLHLRVVDNNPTARPRNYFSEVFTDANYTQMVHAHDHGASRDAAITLPTNMSAGVPHSYYVQSYSQNPGSPPSSPVRIGPVQMAGSTIGVMPQSAGTGTANTQGTAPGQGYGIYPTRKATGSKRTV